MLPPSRTRWVSPHRIGLIAALASAIAIAACTTSSTAPRVDVTGSWTLQGVFFADSDTLQITGLTMNLNQSGSAFSGPYSGAVFAVYNRPTFTPASSATEGHIIAGNTTGATVRFSLDQSKQLFQGVLTDSAMSGSGTISHAGSSGSETFTGTWTAQKAK